MALDPRLTTRAQRTLVAGLRALVRDKQATKPQRLLAAQMLRNIMKNLPGKKRPKGVIGRPTNEVQAQRAAAAAKEIDSDTELLNLLGDLTDDPDQP